MTDTQYRASVLKLINGLRAWRGAHPNVEALVQIKRPRGIVIAASLSDAYAKGFILANPAGVEMLRSVGMDPSPENKGEPTLLMLEMALEAGSNSPARV